MREYRVWASIWYLVIIPPILSLWIPYPPRKDMGRGTRNVPAARDALPPPPSLWTEWHASGGKNSKHIYFVYFYSKSEIEPLFKNADPDGDGHVSLEDGAKILAQKFPSCRQRRCREFLLGKNWDNKRLYYLSGNTGRARLIRTWLIRSST